MHLTLNFDSCDRRIEYPLRKLPAEIMHKNEMIPQDVFYFLDKCFLNGIINN